MKYCEKKKFFHHFFLIFIAFFWTIPSFAAEKRHTHSHTSTVSPLRKPKQKKQSPSKKNKNIKKASPKGARLPSTRNLLNKGENVVHILAKPILYATPAGALISQQKDVKNLISVNSYQDPRDAPDNSSLDAFQTPFGQLEWPYVATHMYEKNGKMYVKYQGYTLELTLDPALQHSAGKYLDRAKILHGSTALIDSKTGRILALSQTGGHKNASLSVTSKAPAASLMKIITASAAIEKANLNPDDEISFRGGCGTLTNDNWLADSRRDIQKLSFTQAFGSSCNTIFARLALYSVGLSSLKVYAEKFMFNKPIPSDLKFQTSMFLLPDTATATPREVAEAGAGFGATRLNPIHAALLSATIQNQGIMMAPFLVEAAYNKTGQEIYRAKTLAIKRTVSAKTASKVETLMLATIATGTSRRAFHRAGTLSSLDEIGGKTGTLLDPENRNVLYTWFSGVALLNSPDGIAIGTVVASPQNLVVRASTVAQTLIADYLRLERRNEHFTGSIN